MRRLGWRQYFTLNVIAFALMILILISGVKFEKFLKTDFIFVDFLIKFKGHCLSIFDLKILNNSVY